MGGSSRCALLSLSQLWQLSRPRFSMQAREQRHHHCHGWEHACSHVHLQEGLESRLSMAPCIHLHAVMCRSVAGPRQVPASSQAQQIPGPPQPGQAQQAGSYGAPAAPAPSQQAQANAQDGYLYGQAQQQNNRYEDDLELLIDSGAPTASTYVARNQRMSAQRAAADADDDVRQFASMCTCCAVVGLSQACDCVEAAVDALASKLQRLGRAPCKHGVTCSELLNSN